MSNEFELFHIYAETPIHAGSGSDIGIVDLPIQRERHTEYPVIWSSSLKGAIRDFYNKSGKNTDDLFGPWEMKDDKSDIKIGKLSFSDAKILAFPVRSTKVPFVWITSPNVLNRYMRTITMTNKKFSIPILNEPFKGTDQEAFVIDNSILEGNQIFLEEFGLNAKVSKEFELTAGFLSEHAAPSEQAYDYIQKKIKKDVVLVKDDIFKFMSKSFMEVNPRIRINTETGVVQEGALWYEEDLPEDAIMYFTISYSVNDKDSNEFLDFFDGKRFIIGGNKTIGKGIFTARRYQ